MTELMRFLDTQLKRGVEVLRQWHATSVAEKQLNAALYGGASAADVLEAIQVAAGANIKVGADTIGFSELGKSFTRSSTEHNSAYLDALQ